MRRALGLLAIAFSIAAASDAAAQPAAGAPNPEAVRHFQAGKKLRDEGRCDLAIPEFEASIRADDESIGAHYNLGVCYERTNTKKAYFHYSRAAELAKQRDDDRLREIRVKLADFLDRTPYIRLAIPQPWPTGLRITVDGVSLHHEELDTETIYFPATDKPTYEVRVSAPGYDDATLSVKRKALATVVLRRSSSHDAAPPPAVATTEPGGWHWQRWLGIGVVAVGVGGVAFALANFFSYDTKRRTLEGQYNDSLALLDQCKPNCSQEQKDATVSLRDQYYANEQDASRNEPIWLGVGIAGVLAIGGGVLLFMTAPSSTSTATPSDAQPTARIRVSPTVGKTQSGLVVSGTF